MQKNCSKWEHGLCDEWRKEGEHLGVCVLLLLVNPVSSSSVRWTLPDLGGPQLRAEDQMAKHFALLECP